MNKIKKKIDEQKYLSKIKPLVTVVIPTYNEEGSIEDCINSLKAQNMPLEIIVVDDGSSDQTVGICKTIGVKVFRQSHKGPGAARNLGAGKAEGNILVFIDADMTFAFDYVTKLIAPIISGEAIATCHWNEMVANWHNPWARCQTWYLGLPDKRRQPFKIPPHELVYRAVRKDFFMETGGFEEKMGRGEDIFIATQTGIMAKIVENAVCYHQNAGSISEVFRETIWRGRTIPEGKKQTLKRSLIAITYENPINNLTRGIILGIKKQEPYMPLYAILYSVGFTLGVIQALVYKRYAK